MPRALPRFDFRVDYAGVTDVGRERPSNQDLFAAIPELSLFAIADGMGGHAAGDVAARLAIDTAALTLRGQPFRSALDRFVVDPSLGPRHAIFGGMRTAVEKANEAVRAEAARRQEPQGMGTTLDLALLVRDRAFIAHAGDARVYLARSSTVIQLTHDHGLSEALAATVRAVRGPLVNAVGIAPEIAVDTCFVELTKGDRLLLCTDGVHTTMESESTVAQLLRTGSADDAAHALVDHALEHGGRDNATAVVVEICERFVSRGLEADPASGPVSSDIQAAARSPLLDGLPMPLVLAALAAAVEVEIPKGERVPQFVASDTVAYIVVSGQVLLPNGRVLGSSGFVYGESLVGVKHEGELPIVLENARLMRLRADDFAEVCARDIELSNALHIRLARHLARRR